MSAPGPSESDAHNVRAAAALSPDVHATSATAASSAGASAATLRRPPASILSIAPEMLLAIVRAGVDRPLGGAYTWGLADVWALGATCKAMAALMRRVYVPAHDFPYERRLRELLAAKGASAGFMGQLRVALGVHAGTPMLTGSSVLYAIVYASGWRGAVPRDLDLIYHGMPVEELHRAYTVRSRRPLGNEGHLMYALTQPSRDIYTPPELNAALTRMARCETPAFTVRISGFGHDWDRCFDQVGNRGSDGGMLFDYRRLTRVTARAIPISNGFSLNALAVYASPPTSMTLTEYMVENFDFSVCACGIYLWGEADKLVFWAASPSDLLERRADINAQVCNNTELLLERMQLYWNRGFSFQYDGRRVSHADMAEITEARTAKRVRLR